MLNLNTALSTLTQLGFGPPGGYVVSDSTQTWSDLFQGRKDAEFVKTYICYKTKQLFDPPTNSSALTALNNIIAELEWRITILKGGE